MSPAKLILFLLLVLASTYSWNFDQAIDAFKKAYSLNPDQSYIQWKQQAEKQREEKRKLDEQQANAKK